MGTVELIINIGVGIGILLSFIQCLIFVLYNTFFSLFLCFPCEFWFLSFCHKFRQICCSRCALSLNRFLFTKSDNSIKFLTMDLSIYWNRKESDSGQSDKYSLWTPEWVILHFFNLPCVLLIRSCLESRIRIHYSLSHNLACSAIPFRHPHMFFL